MRWPQGERNGRFRVKKYPCANFTFFYSSQFKITHSHHTEGWYDLSRILRTWTVYRKMMVGSIDWYLGLIVGQDHFLFDLFPISLCGFGAPLVFMVSVWRVKRTSDNSSLQSADFWCVCVCVWSSSTPLPSTVASL